MSGRPGPLPAHGTISRYGRGCRCEPCRKARSDYLRKRSGRTVPPLQPCGTPAAYQRHLRSGEQACDACRTAYTAHRKQVKAARAKPAPAFPDADPRAVRNGAPVARPYEYRARVYPWAVRRLAQAEALYGRPEDDQETAA